MGRFVIGRYFAVFIGSEDEVSEFSADGTDAKSTVVELRIEDYFSHDVNWI